MEFPRLLPQFPGACVTLVLPEEAPGTVILPLRGVRIQQIPLFQKAPPLPLPPWPSPAGPGPVRCPRGLASHKHFASPLWPPEERQGLVLQAGSRRAVWPDVSGRILLSFWTLPRSPQTSLLISLRWFPLVHPLPQLGETLFTCLLETTCPAQPQSFPPSDRAETDLPPDAASGLSSSESPRVRACSLSWPHLPGP